MESGERQEGEGVGQPERGAKAGSGEGLGVNKSLERRLQKIHKLLGGVTSSPHIHDLVEVVIATATSLPLCRSDHAAPLWLLVEGNPSSGKTDAVFTLKGVESVFWLDTLTENSFLSGYVEDDKSKAGRRRPHVQLLDQLDDKTLVIKDFTTLLSGKDEKVKRVFGELQSIFDGEFSKATGTVGVLRSKSRFAMIACVTPAAVMRHRQYMSLIGGRFLTFTLPPLSDSERRVGFEHCWNETARQINLKALGSEIKKHVRELVQAPPDLIPEDGQVQRTLSQYSELLARGRGIVLTNKSFDLDDATGEETIFYEMSKPQIEEPWRAVQQLRTLVRAVARIHGRMTVNEHDLELARRLVFGTLLNERADYLACFQQGKEHLTVENFRHMLGKRESTVRQTLKQLESLRLVERLAAQTGITFRPIPDLREVIIKPMEPLDHRHDRSDGDQAA
jgi:hypothetical protein